MAIKDSFDEKRLEKDSDVLNISEHVLILHLGRYVATQRYIISEIEKFLKEWEEMMNPDEG